MDTTGEQSPTATMSTGQKLQIARQHPNLGVDIGETGFPASSDADFEAVKLIATKVGNSDGDEFVPVICGLAGANAIHHHQSINADDDLIALVSDEASEDRVFWNLKEVQVTCGTLGLSTATVKLVNGDGEEQNACSLGEGPVHAAYKAVDLIVKVPVTFLEYSMTPVTKSIGAKATTRVSISGDDCHAFSGTGAGRDIVVSSVRAYVIALNKVLSFKNRSVESSTRTAQGGLDLDLKL